MKLPITHRVRFAALAAATLLGLGHGSSVIAETAATAHTSDVSSQAVETNWAISGDADIAPTQVIQRADGVYIFLKNIDYIPAIYADAPGGLVLQHWHVHGQWIVVDSSEWHLIFRRGDKTAVAMPAGVATDSNARVQIGAAVPPASPVQGGLLPPTASLSPNEAIVSTSTGSPSPKATPSSIEANPSKPDLSSTRAGRSPSGLLKATNEPSVPSLVSSPAERASIPTTSSPMATPIYTFTVTEADGTLRDALDRWLKSIGWQLAWDLPDDDALGFHASFDGTLPEIVAKVMGATDHMKMHARACQNENNVIRVIQRAANCLD